MVEQQRHLPHVVVFPQVGVPEVVAEAVAVVVVVELLVGVGCRFEQR